MPWQTNSTLTIFYLWNKVRNYKICLRITLPLRTIKNPYMSIPYQTWSEYMATIFPGRIQKIAVNASLGCPNRDGHIGTGGCIYCNNVSFNPSYANKSLPDITKQLSDGIRFFKLKGDCFGYLAYFQSYTNTYGEDKALIKLYEEALSYPGVVGLVIATRPDSLSGGILDYFQQRFCNKAPESHPYLLVEIGIESTKDSTLHLINRGHTYSQSVEAINELYSRGIAVGAHLILGLPGEERDDMLLHAKRISKLPIKTLKLHQLQVVKGTPLAAQYANNPDCVRLFTPHEYASLLIDFIKLLRPDIALDRFVSETPTDMLIAPRWGIKPSEFSTILNGMIAQSGY